MLYRSKGNASCQGHPPSSDPGDWRRLPWQLTALLPPIPVSFHSSSHYSSITHAAHTHPHKMFGVQGHVLNAQCNRRVRAKIKLHLHWKKEEGMQFASNISVQPSSVISRTLPNYIPFYGMQRTWPIHLLEAGLLQCTTPLDSCQEPPVCCSDTNDRVVTHHQFPPLTLLATSFYESSNQSVNCTDIHLPTCLLEIMFIYY